MSALTDAYREHPVWSKPGIEPYLTQAWNEGTSARAIAEEIRRRTREHCSKDMVAAKAKRMGLPKRESPIGKKRRIAPTGWPKVQPRGRVSECAWPLNDGRPWRFCCQPTIPGRPYCDAHHQESLASSNKKLTRG